MAKAGKELGYLGTAEVKEVSLQTAADKVTGNGNTGWTELGFASRSRTQSHRSRELGWKPKMSREDFENSFVEEWKELIPGLRKE